MYLRPELNGMYQKIIVDFYNTCPINHLVIGFLYSLAYVKLIMDIKIT